MGITIGTLSQRTGVGVETLRYYEREGLIPEPPRQPTGYRNYPEEAVGRVRFIRRAKVLGFTLREVRELLELGADPNTPCREIRHRAVAHLDDITQRIVSLDRMRVALGVLVASCPGEGPTSTCPILWALADDQGDEGPA